ncbi:MAG: hypothetical protein SP1CHLAM54_17700 [Chlamydiia bacterium]|nr:hypothetical protein [Chlamydiia bacterium]MCH9616658.1 hypothetical protein [Chlamydiia bacterium]MCH9629388.1 hypothetical protein [Chlamydiia bacterium]
MAVAGTNSRLIFTVDHVTACEDAKGLSGRTLKTYKIDANFNGNHITFIGYGELKLVFQTLHALGSKFAIGKMTPVQLKAFKANNANEQFHLAHKTDSKTGEGSVRVFSVTNGQFVNPHQTRVAAKISQEVLKQLLDYALASTPKPVEPPVRAGEPEGPFLQARRAIST